MKRVMIVGGPGSGKSTLARMLGDVTGLPVFHMDHIHWTAGWEERTPEEKDMLTHDIHIQLAWILEGGHSRTYPERVARADTMIWLDFPLWLRVWRVLKRTVIYFGQTRPDLPDGCPERFDLGTLNFLSFIWRTRHTARAKLLQIYEQPLPHLDVVRLRNLRQVNAFIERVARTV